MWGEERHLHEECGVFGVCSPKEQDVASLTYYGLFADRKSTRLNSSH